MLRMILLLLALGAGGTAAWLTSTIQGQESPEAVIVERSPEPPSQEVLVAAADIAQGTVLEGAELQWQVWPESSVHPAFISRSARPDALDDLIGTAVRQSFVAGEPLREEKLTSAGASLLSTALPSGRRAVAIRVSAENTAGGFILPNDRVDVLHTRSASAADAGRGDSETRTILTNIRVLAIDQAAENEASETVIGKTATLELDSRQVEIITAAEASGQISLALRSVADHADTPRVEVPEAEPKGRAIQVFRGGRGELVRIQ